MLMADNEVYTQEEYKPAQIELDILTLIVRLEQMDAEDRPTHWLWADRVMGCDVPRLRAHCSAEALLWVADVLAGGRANEG